MPRPVTGFLVTNLVPAWDPRWYTATPAQRGAYMRAVRELVATEYDRQLASGLDRAGQPLFPIAASTRKYRRSAMGPADPNAPPLTPAYALSRTRAWVQVRAVGVTIRVSWPARWARILRYHQEGSRRLPIRDVWGLAPEGHNRVVQAGLLWWNGYISGMPFVMPRREPRPGARPSAAQQPFYQPLPKNVALHGTHPPTTADIAIGGHVYTLGRGGARELLGAVKAGTFTGFRSYAK